MGSDAEMMKEQCRVLEQLMEVGGQWGPGHACLAARCQQPNSQQPVCQQGWCAAWLAPALLSCRAFGELSASTQLVVQFLRKYGFLPLHACRRRMRRWRTCGSWCSSRQPK